MCIVRPDSAPGPGVDATGRFAPEAVRGPGPPRSRLRRTADVSPCERVRMQPRRPPAIMVNRDVFFDDGRRVGAPRCGSRGGDYRRRGGPALLPWSGGRVRARRCAFRRRGPRWRFHRDRAGRARSDFASYSAGHRMRPADSRTLFALRPAGVAERCLTRRLVRERLGPHCACLELAGPPFGLAGADSLPALAQSMTAYDAAALHLSRVPGADLLEGFASGDRHDSQAAGALASCTGPT